MKRKKLITASLIAGAMLFTACGGGGGGGGGNGGNDGSEVSMSGLVVDGYLRYSSICLDLNGDGYCQMGDEPMTTTGKNGGFKLVPTKAQIAHANYKTADLIAYGGQDSDTLKDFNHKLRYSQDGTVTEDLYITPLSTIVAKVKASDSTLDLTQAKKKVSDMLDITDTQLNSDPIAQAKGGKTQALNAALQLQKAVEILVKAAKEETKYSSSSEKEITDKIYQALAIGVTKSTKIGIKEMINTAASQADSKALLGKNATAIKGAAIIMAENVNSVITTKLSGKVSVTDISKASVQIDTTKEIFENGVKSIVTASGFDPEATVDYTSNGIDENTYKDNEVGSDEDFIKKLIKNALVYVGIKNPTTDQINKVYDAGTFKAGVTIEDIQKALEDDANLSEILASFKQKTQEQDAKKESVESSNKAASYSFKDYSKFYNAKIKREDWGNGLFKRYKYETNEFHENNNTFSWQEYKRYSNQTMDWVLDSDDNNYVFEDGAWKKGDGKVTPSSDGKVITFADGGKVSIVDIKDIKDKKVYFKYLATPVTMPADSKKYILKFTSPNESYEVWEKARTHGNATGTYYTTLSSLIEHQCGNSYFSSAEDTSNVGIAFKCGEQDKSSGSLVESNHGTILTDNIGTWEIKSLSDGSKVLLTHPTNKEAYSDDGGWESFFVEGNIDGSGVFVWRGDYTGKQFSTTFSEYNVKAFTAIKAAFDADYSKYNYVTGGATDYDGVSHTIVKARSYQSRITDHPVQLFLQTSTTQRNNIGGLRITIKANKFATNQALKDALIAGEVTLSSSDLIGAQYLTHTDDFQNVSMISGSLKLVWNDNEDKFTIKQNDAVLEADTKTLTISDTIVLWTNNVNN